MTTSRATATELRNVLDYLINNEIALFTNPVVEVNGWVTWPANRGVGIHRTGVTQHATPDDYKYWVENSIFSAVLADGALLQCSWQFAGNFLIKHRLCWVPAPFAFEQDDLKTESLSDLIAIYGDGAAADVLLGGPVRFDYDLNAAAPGHPASHLTINSSTCRVACHAPVRLGVFLEFIFLHFYPDIWREHAYLRELPHMGVDKTLTDDEKSGIHVAWAV